jgi:hypothetical protein
MTEPLITGHMAAAFMLAMGITIVAMCIGAVVEHYAKKRKHRRREVLPTPREDSRNSVTQFRRMHRKGS